MLAPRALAHNKFLVICDEDGSRAGYGPAVRTGRRPGCARRPIIPYSSITTRSPTSIGTQWTLQGCGGRDPQRSKVKQQRTARPNGGRHVDAHVVHADGWASRSGRGEGDIIMGAKQAMLFLMFNPDPTTRCSTRSSRRRETVTREGRLYIHGAINQDPSTTKNPVKLFDKGNWENADFEVVLPAAIDDVTSFRQKRARNCRGRSQWCTARWSVIDPFSEHPVVLTGSHNLGPKASGTNDENLLIIRDAPGLAAAYATNIMSVYNQYRWRFRRQIPSPRTSVGRDSRTTTPGRKPTSRRGARHCVRWLLDRRVSRARREGGEGHSELTSARISSGSPRQCSLIRFLRSSASRP